MAWKHFVREAAEVRLGRGRYVVRPLSVLGVVNLITACGQVGVSLGDLTKADPATGLTALRLLLPVVLQRQVKPRHLRRATPMQVLNAFFAAERVNDLGYVFGAFAAEEGGEGERMGLETTVVLLAERFGMSWREVLEMPMREVLAVIDALRAQPGGGEPVTDDEKRRLAEVAAAAGWQVN